jgi:hypothetical protein
MEKFAVNFDRFKEEVLFECILHGSLVACQYSFEDFYTHNGEPKNWKDDFLSDVHACRRIEYGEEIFFVNRDTEIDSIRYIFHGGKVYSFDSYYTDCPILQRILK